MSRVALLRLVAPLAATLVLAACTFGSQGGGSSPAGGVLSTTDAATEAACRQRADEMYNRQHRGELYSAPSSMNSPYSANYNAGITTRGLSDLYARDTAIRDCVRNTGTETDRTAPGTPPAQVPSAQIPSAKVPSAKP